MQLGPIYSLSGNQLRVWSADLNLYDAKNAIIKIESIDMEIPEGAYCSYTTTSGIQGSAKMLTSAPTLVTSGKNLGKRNATNVLTQAHADVTRKMTVKIKAGYTTSNPTTHAKGAMPTAAAAAAPTAEQAFPFAMAVKNIADHPEKARYPTHLQPKLDGIRAVATFIDGKVVMKTRRLHDIEGFEPLKAELKKMFIAYRFHQGLFIDGELYQHGLPLQTISGIVRGSDHQRQDTLQFHVFDAFRVVGDQQPFEERLIELVNFTTSIPMKYVTRVETVIASNSSEADSYYEKRLELGYEGTIYKPFGRSYEWSFTREKRSGWYLKRKAKFDAEFPIVRFESGQGKDAECVTFTFETKNGYRFNATPNGSYDYRKMLYKRCVDDFDQFRGKLMTIAYEDLSADGVPLRARAIAFRDLSFD